MILTRPSSSRSCRPLTRCPLSCSRWSAGVLADIFDRARLLVAVLAGMTVAGAALTALTAAHRMPPALLLMFTFVLGTGAILVTPAYQSLVPDMVPRPQVPSCLGARLDQHQPGPRHRPGDRRAAGRPDRGGRRVRPEHGDVPALRDRGGVPSPAGRDSAVSRAVHPGAAGRRQVRAPRTRRAAHPAARGPVPGAGQCAVGAAAPDRHPPARTGFRRVRRAARCPGGRRHRRRVRPAADPGQAVRQCPGGRREPDLRGGAGRGGAVAQPRADHPGAAAGRCGLDSLPVERQRRAAAVPAQVGTRPRPVGLPDGPVRRPGRRGCDLGSRRRGCWAGARLPDLRRRHGRRRGNHLVLAVPPDRRHGPEPGPLARAATAHQR